MLRVLQRVSAWIFCIFVLLAIAIQLPFLQQWVPSDIQFPALQLIDLPLLFSGLLLASTSFILSIEDGAARRNIRILVTIFGVILFAGMLLLNFYYPPKDFVG